MRRILLLSSLCFALAACAMRNNDSTLEVASAKPANQPATGSSDLRSGNVGMPSALYHLPIIVPPEERHCLAQAVYFEARRESLAGQRAVAGVVINRMLSPKFPDTICEVVQQGGENGRFRCQFSWWCDGKSDAPGDAVAWVAALKVADEMLSGRVADPSKGALYFHATYVRPRWRKQLAQTASIDNHIFYR